MTNLDKIEELFDEKFGNINPKYVYSQEGRETCVMCGAPTKVDKVYIELKSFYRQKIEELLKAKMQGRVLYMNGYADCKQEILEKLDNQP